MLNKQRPKRPKNLKEELRPYLSQEELDLLVRSYDVVGDLAIIIIPDELVGKQQLIGETVLRINKNVKVVLKRAGEYQGQYRLIPLEIIAGEDRKETMCKENGVRLLLNPETAYYSVRSGSERSRIASLIEEGENVLVMFSGVAPFPLVLSKHSKAGQIVGIEKNPDACMYAEKNRKLNKKLKNVELFCGDVNEVLPALKTTFDRILMPLPKSADQFLELAIQHLAPSGHLHYYTILEKDDFNRAVEDVEGACKAVGRVLQRHEVVIAGHCGPGKYRICLDCEVGGG